MDIKTFVEETQRQLNSIERRLNSLSGGAGQANTASNIGVGGVGLYQQKVGVDLQFRNINAASARISVALDAGNNEVDIDIVQAQIDHGSIGGLGDDDHAQYLLVDGTRAMVGNLDLGANQIINVGNIDGVDISNHSARHELAGADQIDHNNLLNYVAAEHYDWTNETHDFSTNGNIQANRIGLGTFPTQLIDMQSESVLCPIYMTTISSSNQWHSPQILTRRARGTIGSVSAVQNADLLCRQDIFAHDGSAYILSAYLRWFADGAPTDVGDIVPSKAILSVQNAAGAPKDAIFYGHSLYLTHGVLALRETTTPTAVADVGRLYTKADNLLYFQSGDGVEHTIAYV